MGPSTTDDLASAPSGDLGLVGSGRRATGRLLDLRSRSRQIISEHRHKRKLRELEVSDQSRRGLDWTNFFMSDVQIAFGSFLAFYLADLGWSKQDVGIALTIGGLAGVLFLIPGGAVTDAVRWKRGLAGLGILAIGGAALLVAIRPGLVAVYAARRCRQLQAEFLRRPSLRSVSGSLAATPCRPG
jgi:hypothetical protein